VKRRARVGEWGSGRVGEWGMGRVGEWESGRVGDWETGEEEEKEKRTVNIERRAFNDQLRTSS